MKITSYAVARPAHYDRNAQSVIQSDAAIYAPHTATTRFTYTVASGKKLFVETTTTFISLVTAPTVAAQAQCILRMSQSATVFTDPSRVDLPLTAAVLATVFHSITGQTTIYAGESVSGITLNASTGGTVLHNVAFKGTLFDA